MRWFSSIKWKITTQILVDPNPKLPQSEAPVAQNGKAEGEEDGACEKLFINQFSELIKPSCVEKHNRIWLSDIPRKSADTPKRRGAIYLSAGNAGRLGEFDDRIQPELALICCTVNRLQRGCKLMRPGSRRVLGRFFNAQSFIRTSSPPLEIFPLFGISTPIFSIKGFTS